MSDGSPRGRAWRLLRTGAGGAAENLALDEALLRSRLAGGPPTVRFYAWRERTVSLGYAQPLDGRVSEAWCRRTGIGLVRRPTGGSAVLHGPEAAEVTYSVVARSDDLPGGGDLAGSYRVLAAGLAAGLRRLGVAPEVAPLDRGRNREPDGPVFCFARTGTSEISVEGRKLVGSAQRRQGGAFLQHGSILLCVDPVALDGVFPGTGASRAVASLEAILGRRPDPAEVVAALAEGLSGVLGTPLVPGVLEPGEVALTEHLRDAKYATENWLREGVWSAGWPGAVGAGPVGIDRDAGLPPTPALR